MQGGDGTKDVGGIPHWGERKQREPGTPRI